MRKHERSPNQKSPSARTAGDSQFSLSASLKLKARSWKTWKQTRMQSQSTSKTRLLSVLKSIQSTFFTLSYQTGKLETHGASSSGHLSTANQLCSDGRNAVTTQTTEPAERRALYSLKEDWALSPSAVLLLNSTLSSAYLFAPKALLFHADLRAHLDQHSVSVENCCNS